MHAEDFMQPIEWINNLKWRVSYGQTGNNSVGYYDAFGLYSVTTSYDGQPAVITSAMPNPTLKWEKTTQLDVGFDFSVLNDRIPEISDIDILLFGGSSSCIGGTCVKRGNFVGRMSLRFGIEIAIVVPLI